MRKDTHISSKALQDYHDVLDTWIAITSIIISLSCLTYTMTSETKRDKSRSCKSHKPWMFPVLGSPAKDSKTGIDMAIFCLWQNLLEAFKTTFTTLKLALKLTKRKSSPETLLDLTEPDLQLEEQTTYIVDATFRTLKFFFCLCFDLQTHNLFCFESCIERSLFKVNKV